MTHEVPVICVGNLNLGGAGKTPFTEYLVTQLSESFQVGVVSRGYGRKTKGFIQVQNTDSPEKVGDEPLQMAKKLGYKANFVVCEDRNQGIQQLFKLHPSTQVIVLDDAFQHRKTKPHFNILLSPANQPYHKEFLIPAGNLRDIKYAANRADIVVQTKTTQEPSEIDWNILEQSTKRHRSWDLFSTYLKYSWLPKSPNTSQPIILVTGIANPQPLLQYLEEKHVIKQHLNYADHYSFQPKDIERIQSIFNKFADCKPLVVTTEKDWVKLAPLLKDSELKNHFSQLALAIGFHEGEDVFLKRLHTQILMNLA